MNALGMDGTMDSYSQDTPDWHALYDEKSRHFVGMFEMVEDGNAVIG